MSRHIRILSVGSEIDVLTARNAALARAGFRVTSACSRHQAVLLATSHHFDAAILCWSLPRDVREGLHHDLQIINPKTRVLVLSPPALESQEAGFPVEPETTRLIQMVRAALLNPL
jgi:DNA-binding response OmpR family regulator